MQSSQAKNPMETRVLQRGINVRQGDGSTRGATIASKELVGLICSLKWKFRIPCSKRRLYFGWFRVGFESPGEPALF